ncbi:MAG: hypothetical protein FWF81_13540 [Defluviitaleaceae bacterium]|nr:hypothetical protein [Defluviitaleaceae bacterium]
MANILEIRERHKIHLQSLLNIKKANQDENITVAQLQEEIKRVVGTMDQEDVAWIEKIVGVKAL